MARLGVPLVFTMWLILPVAAPAAANPVQMENSRHGTAGWSSVTETANVEGYVDQTSVAPGGTLAFHVASHEAGARYRLVIFRLGWYGGLGARLVTCVPGCDADRDALYPPPGAVDAGDGETRAGWPATDTLLVGADWVSGYYEARVVITAGPSSGRAHRIWFVVREAQLQPSRVLVQVPVNTWQAYNGWGGASLYDFNSKNGRRATRVSFERPYALDMPGSQASPLGWEYQLVRFLEREGVDVSYQTDVDTDREPGSLLRHRLVMTAGHGEYWTKGMRDAFEDARDHSTNLAFLGANNAYWHVRYENDRRTLVCYKSLADPTADPALVTILFRDLDRPECQLIGVQHEGFLRDQPGDYFVDEAAVDDRWFEGTGLPSSGAIRGLVSREYDSLPFWRPRGCHQPGLRVLLHDRGALPAQATRYVAPSGARVFASGSLQFSWGLDAFGTDAHGHPGTDAGLQQFMRNALDDLGRPAPPGPVAAVAVPGRVVVTPSLSVDPRVEGITVSRHEGDETFDPAGPTAVAVCRALAPCHDSVPGHRTYRYAATAADRWTVSRPAYSEPVVVPNSAPGVQIRGPRAVRTGRRVVYAARVSDRDGDSLTLRWQLNGRRLAGRNRRVSVIFGRSRRHRLTAVVHDGYGGRTTATLVVRVGRR